MTKQKKKRKNIPKWRMGFGVTYLADEHCSAHDPKRESINREHLMLRSAVLANAITDLETLDGPLFNEARLWILGHIKSMPGFSFADICQTFDISPDAARQAILERYTGNNRCKIYARGMR